jgi:hypothetical protein
MANEYKYHIVRIHNTWNKSMSIFYATVADTSICKKMTTFKINQILSTLNSKWINHNSRLFFI